MIRAWRITSAKWAAGAFAGQGAKLNGGRWNNVGTSAVYLSAHLSLCALEMLVHADPADLPDFVSIPVDVPPALSIEDVDPAKLSSRWRDELSPPELRAFGDEWVRAGRSLLLRVPSVVIPDEENYVVNPAHPQFPKLKIGEPRLFSFDPRLLAL